MNFFESHILLIPIVQWVVRWCHEKINIIKRCEKVSCKYLECEESNNNFADHLDSFSHLSDSLSPLDFTFVHVHRLRNTILRWNKALKKRTKFSILFWFTKSNFHFQFFFSSQISSLFSFKTKEQQRKKKVHKVFFSSILIEEKRKRTIISNTRGIEGGKKLRKGEQNKRWKEIIIFERRRWWFL